MFRRVVLLSFLAATPAEADALLDQAIAHGGGYDPQAWAYISTTRINAGGSNVVSDAWERATSGGRAAAPTRNVRIVAYDPSKPAGERQRVISDDSSDRPDQNGAMIHTDEGDKLPSYDDVRRMVKPDAVRVGDTVATATYRFRTALNDIKHIGSATLNLDTDTPVMLSGTAIVQKTGLGAPYVKSVVLYLPTGDHGRGNAAAKIRQLSLGLRFSPDAQRQTPLLQAFGFDSRFQALGLMTIDASFINKVDGYRYVGTK